MSATSKGRKGVNDNSMSMMSGDEDDYDVSYDKSTSKARKDGKIVKKQENNDESKSSSRSAAKKGSMNIKQIK